MEEVLDFELDNKALKEEKEVMIEKTKHPKAKDMPKTRIAETNDESSDIVSCLQNRKVIVRYIIRPNGNITDPRHVLYGRMAETATRTFTVPMLSNGAYVNVLTKKEMAYLEEVMGLPEKALSIYLKENNYWDNYFVRLHKYDTILDLSNPNDYISYKVLLANKDLIAPSYQAYQNTPKATYQYYITSDDQEVQNADLNLSNTMLAYKEFGKIENDKEALRTIIRLMDGRPTAATNKITFFKTEVNKLLQGDPKQFVKIVTDPLFRTKVLIFQACEAKLIARRANQYFLVKDNTPMCGNYQEPTLENAAKYLNDPVHNDLLVYLASQINKE